jgi:hypothetical protein
LKPAHPALGQNYGERERGYAVDNNGAVDVHGKTANLTPDQITKLLKYVNSIE